MAKIKNSEFPADVIKNWMRLKATIEFLGIWEQINNPILTWSNSTGLKEELWHTKYWGIELRRFV